MMSGDEQLAGIGRCLARQLAESIVDAFFAADDLEDVAIAVEGAETDEQAVSIVRAALFRALLVVHDDFQAACHE